jgi:hypothetical protein
VHPPFFLSRPAEQVTLHYLRTAADPISGKLFRIQAVLFHGITSAAAATHSEKLQNPRPGYYSSLSKGQDFDLHRQLACVVIYNSVSQYAVTFGPLASYGRSSLYKQ